MVCSMYACMYVYVYIYTYIYVCVCVCLPKARPRFWKLDSALPSYIRHGLFQLMPKLVVNFTHLTMRRVETSEVSQLALGKPNSIASRNIKIHQESSPNLDVLENPLENPLNNSSSSLVNPLNDSSNLEIFPPACCFCSWQKSRVVSHSRSTCQGQCHRDLVPIGC